MKMQKRSARRRPPGPGPGPAIPMVLERAIEALDRGDADEARRQVVLALVSVEAIGRVIADIPRIVDAAYEETVGGGR